MPSPKTIKLIEYYGKDLLTGEISDADLQVLLSGVIERRESLITDDESLVPVNDPILLTEASAIYDFVQTLFFGNLKQLHQINARVINLCQKPYCWTSMIMFPTLPEALIAYELLHEYDYAKLYLESETFKIIFPSPEKMRFFTEIHLYQVMQRFRAMAEFPHTSPDESLETGSYQLVLRDIQERLAVENETVLHIVNPLVKYLIEEREYFLSYKSSYTFRLENVLYILEGRLSAKEFMDQRMLSSSIQMVLPSVREVTSGVALIASAMGLSFITGGWALPVSALFIWQGIEQAFPKLSPEISKLMGLLVNHIEAEDQKRIPSPHPLLRIRSPSSSQSSFFGASAAAAAVENRMHEQLPLSSTQATP